MEINPNHPTTMGVHDHWHKVAALLMMKMGVRDVIISPDEISRMEGNNIAIKFDNKLGIILKIVSDEEVIKIAVKEGVPEGQYRSESIKKGIK